MGYGEFRRFEILSLLVTGDRQSVGRYTRQNPNTKVNVTLDLQHGLGSDSVSGSLSGEWVHGLFMADYGRQPLDDVFVLDLALRYAHRLSDRALLLEPYLLLGNLLDSRYAYVEGYQMPGFNLLAGLRIGV